MSLSINIMYYFLPYNIRDVIYSTLIYIMVVFYVSGHTLSQINFLDRVQSSIQMYNNNNNCCNYNNIFRITTYIILPIPFLTLLIMIMVPSFEYNSIMFSVWILFELFVMINIGYLYLNQLSILHALKYKNKELDTMIRISWNIIWTMLISLICIISIYYMSSPSNSNENVIYLIFSTNIFISIICMISLIDIDEFPCLLSFACLCGDYICGCCYCCCCDFRPSGTGHHKSVSTFSMHSPKLAAISPRFDGRTAVSDVDISDDEDDVDLGIPAHTSTQIEMADLKVASATNNEDDIGDDISPKSVKSIDSGDGHYETEEKAEVISMKKLTDDGSHLDKIKDEKLSFFKPDSKIRWNRINGNTFEIRPKGYYLSVNG